ncbi:MAG: hypothetical protein IPL20_02995 [Saprospiraceae bacterium]|nr:hypothetical protein [Saprospiraceae bacterium]
MEYFTSLTSSDLERLIKSTTKSLFLCMPSIHKEIAEAIAYLDSLHNMVYQNNVKIHLLIDFDAQTFRQGYGNIGSFNGLRKVEIDIKTLPNNRISFIISDDVGYYLFVESRSLIPADKQIVNAIKIDPVSMVRLKKFFFSTSIEMNFEDELTNAIIDESKQLEKANELLSSQIAQVTKISEQEVKVVSDDLARNPPLKPDYKRIVDFYSNKFQYVKLKFEGSNMQHRKIEIPANALPIADVRLKERLETKLNLFDPESHLSSFKDLSTFKQSVLTIRAEYLKKVKSREESLLDKNKKSEFEKEIETLNKQIETVQNNTVKHIHSLIIQTKENLLEELQDFFIANPKAMFGNRQTNWQGDTDYINSSAKDMAQEVIYKIKWPLAGKLVDEFKLDIQFSDITFEDLKNVKFIKELKEIGLINKEDESQLADFTKGLKLIRK